jgi:hypothetical protein
MKVLYISFDAIYPLYIKSVKDPMTKASLVSYFASNQSYIGHCKSTKFIWYEESVIQKIIDGDATKIPDRIMDKKIDTTSAYVFNYDVLKDLMDVDFERVDEEDLPPNPLNGESEKDPNQYVPVEKEGNSPF